jgi:hypothetical protein
MGQDNPPKVRQLARRTHKQAQRASYERILIVTEGSKTEPLYFKSIQAAYRFPSANVAVQPCDRGTAPLQVVRYARQLFEVGDLTKGIRPKCFDQIYAVFDRDDHASYFDALTLANSLDRKLRNDSSTHVAFRAIASVPNFELWLLLHFENIQAPIHRDEVMNRLRQHLTGYKKGAADVFALTRGRLDTAKRHALALSTKNSAHTDPEPFTAVHELVEVLTSLHG